MIDDIRSIKDFKDNAVELKREYKKFLCSSFLNIKNHIRAKRHWKNIIYNIDMKPYQRCLKDTFWNYLNSDMGYEELLAVIRSKYNEK